MRLNLTFADVPLEAGMVTDFAELIIKSEPKLAQLARDHVWGGLDRSDEVDRKVGHYLEDHIEQGIYLRLLTGASLVASWAVYEAVVTRVANYLRKEKSLGLKLSDLRGDFLGRSRKYFRDVLDTPLHPTDVDWDRLKAIAALRHAVAHGNGQMRHITETRRPYLEQIADTTDGVDLAEGYLIISSKFARDAAQFIRMLINELIERVAPIIREGKGT